jgi:hypothetical protein
LPNFTPGVSGVEDASPGVEPLLLDASASDGATGMGDKEEAVVVEDKQSEDSPLLDWARNHQDAYLDEMVHHDGHARAVACSTGCGRKGGYKCKDCFRFCLSCCECFVKMHSHLPLHRALVSFGWLAVMCGLIEV